MRHFPVPVFAKSGTVCFHLIHLRATPTGVALFLSQFRLRRVLRALNNNTKRSQTWPTETPIPASAKSPIPEL